MRHVAGEAAGLVDGDDLRLVAGLVQDFDRARLDDEEARVAITDLEQPLAVVEPAQHRLLAPREPSELVLGEFEEGDGLRVELGHVRSRTEEGELEATTGFEPVDKGFADPRLTTWLRRPVRPGRPHARPCHERRSAESRPALEIIG